MKVIEKWIIRESTYSSLVSGKGNKADPIIAIKDPSLVSDPCRKQLPNASRFKDLTVALISSDLMDQLRLPKGFFSSLRLQISVMAL